MNKKLNPLLALLLAGVAISCGEAAAAAAPVRMQVVHTDAGRGLTSRELLQRMALRSKARAARFLSRAASATVTPGEIKGRVPDTEYLAHFGIGTPPQPVQLTLDTGSSLVWTQCRPCVDCFHQTLPYFDPSLSSTFAELPCADPACQNLTRAAACGEPPSRTCPYSRSYGDGSVTVGSLEADTFTFAGAGSAAVPGLLFGCGFNNTGIFRSNETGIAGFGRGALSLPSQLKADNFSHCFTAITGEAPSPLLLCLPANLYGSGSAGAVQTTRLIQNPARPSHYYLSLKGITVGSTRLAVPESAFALTANGTGGTIIDSGTGMTSLPSEVYKLVRDAFVAHVNLPVRNLTALSIWQLCFAAPAGTKPEVPKLVLHLDGATLDLPRENYMFEFEDAGGNGFTCLAVNDGGGDVTVIGNYQQQNTHVLYDLANNMISFVAAPCDKL